MNRQQRRSIMRRLRSFMESISGKKFDTLMESFRKGMSAILEADDTMDWGVLSRDVNGVEHVLGGLMDRATDINYDIHRLLDIKDALKERGVEGSFTDRRSDISNAINAIEYEANELNGKEADEAVDDETKKRINDQIAKINEIMDEFKSMGPSFQKDNSPEDNLYITNKIKGVDDVKTVGELMDRIVERIKPEFELVEKKYSDVRERATSVRVTDVKKDESGKVKSGKVSLGPIVIRGEIGSRTKSPVSEYVRFFNSLKRGLEHSDKYKKLIGDLGEKIKISTSKTGPYEQDAVIIDPEVAKIVADEIGRISKPIGTGTVKDDDFAAAAILFYSIAAKKGHLQIDNHLTMGSDNASPRSPRENIALSLYVIMAKAALSMKRFIISRAPGIDWESFETLFKFKLIGRSMAKVGSANINTRDLEDKLEGRGAMLFKKAIEPSEENKEPYPNKRDFTGGMSEDELIAKYGGWIEKYGEYYAPLNKGAYDGTGELVGDLNILDKEGYLAEIKTKEFGKGDGELETCYSDNDFVTNDIRDRAEIKYDNSIELAKLILMSKNGGTDVSDKDVVEDRGATALCIFYSSMRNSELLEYFKVPLYDSARYAVYNIVRVLQSESSKKASIDLWGDTNVSPYGLGGKAISKMYGGSSKTPDNGGDGSYKQGREAFENPGNDISIKIGENGIQELPVNYRKLLNDLNKYCTDNNSLPNPVKDYFEHILIGKDKKKKLGMYMDILKTAGLPTIMNDDGNIVENLREKDFHEAYAFFDNILLLTDAERDVLNEFVNGRYTPGADQNNDSTLESAIKKINKVLKAQEGGFIDTYNKLMSTNGNTFNLSEIVKKYKDIKDENGNNITVNGVGIGTEDKRYIAHEIASVAANDTTGILLPFIDKLNTVENGVAIRINPPNSFHIGSDNSFHNDNDASDVIVFGKLDKNNTKNSTLLNVNAATRDKGVKLTSDDDKQTTIDFEGFPPIQNYRDMYSDAAKNAITYSSVVAQIYSLLVYLSEQYISKDFKVGNLETHLSYKLPDDLQLHLTEKVCDYLNEHADISGDLIDENSGIRKFLDSVIEPDVNENDPKGMTSLREAYDKLIRMLGSDPSVANWKGHGNLKEEDHVIKINLSDNVDVGSGSLSIHTDSVESAENIVRSSGLSAGDDVYFRGSDELPSPLEYGKSYKVDNISIVPGENGSSTRVTIRLKDVKISDKKNGTVDVVKVEPQSPSEKAFEGHKQAIETMVGQVQKMVSDLNSIKESRSPENISYGDLIYLMLCGGLGLTNPNTKGKKVKSYYDSFLNLVKNYNELEKVSRRISMEVCGTYNERVAQMAAGILLLILSTKNDAMINHYKDIDEYENQLKDIDNEKKEIEAKINKVERGEDLDSSMTELMEKYDDLVFAEESKRNKMIRKLEKSVLGVAADIVKNDFNTIVDGLISKVAFNANGENKMDIDYVNDIGRNLLAMVSRNPRYDWDNLTSIIQGLNFKKSKKYIDILNKKTNTDKALVDIIMGNTGKKIFERDEVLSQYRKEYDVITDRIEYTDKNKNDNAENLKNYCRIMIDEFDVITNDQMKDALIGDSGLFTDEYIGSVTNDDPVSRADHACKAIVVHLLKKSRVIKDYNYENEVTVKEFETMMKDILNNKEKQSILAEELRSLYNSDSIKTFVNSINSKFGAKKRHGYATLVLVTLVNDIGIVDPESLGGHQPIPEEYAKVALLKLLNLTDNEVYNTNPDPQVIADTDYDDVIAWLRPLEKELINVFRADIPTNKLRSKLKQIREIALEFLPAVGGDNVLRRKLYHLCADKLFPLILGRAINYMSAIVTSDIIKCIKEIYGENLTDKDILKESGILNGSGEVSDDAVAKLAEAIHESILGNKVLYKRIDNIRIDVNYVNNFKDLKLDISGRDSDLGEIINTWVNLYQKAMSNFK